MNKLTNENPTYKRVCECGNNITMKIEGLKNLSFASISGTCSTCGKLTGVRGKL